MANPRKAAFLWGIREQESGGNYNATNSIGATGAYQVLKSNIAAWTKESLGHSVSYDQFLHSPAIQDAVADHILGGYYDKYGPDGAAAMWYSGQPDASKTYGNPPVYKYVESVLGHAKDAPKGISIPLSGSSAGTSTGSSGGSTDATQAGFGIPSGITNFFKDGITALEGTVHFFTLLFQPSTYVRIGAGFAGLFMLILAMIFLYKETR